MCDLFLARGNHHSSKLENRYSECRKPASFCLRDICLYQWYLSSTCRASGAKQTRLMPLIQAESSEQKLSDSISGFSDRTDSVKATKLFIKVSFPPVRCACHAICLLTCGTQEGSPVPLFEL